MIQVKIINEYRINTLQDEVNEWLKRNKDKKIKDIKFAIDSSYWFMAMIIYEENEYGL